MIIRNLIFLLIFSSNISFAENQAAFANGPTFVDLTTADKILASLTIHATSPGSIVAKSSTSIGYFAAADGDSISGRCSIAKDSTSMNFTGMVIARGRFPDWIPLYLTQHFSVASAGNITINLVCDRESTYVGLSANPSLTAIFIPSS